jgi:hypothetical protein
MSTTVKTGWLHDKNGDKFAPKTLTSQVQTSDGILIEDKIQTDLDTVKQEILDEIGDIDLSTYETKTDAQTKLDEAKSYTDTAISGLATETYVDETIAAQIGGKADSDLSNIDNATFKAKAEESGIGGTSGSMEFKGNVNSLPTTANEGEMYTVSSWNKLGSYIHNDGMILHSTGFYFYSWDDMSNEVYNHISNNYNGQYKFIVDGQTYIYTEAMLSSAGESGFEVYAQTDVTETINVASGATVEVYWLAEGVAAGLTTYVYHQGEFVKTSKSGGVLSVAESGTGATYFDYNAVLIGNGTNPLSQRYITDNTSTLNNIPTSSNLITSNTLRYALNRTTSVDNSDTNYSTYMARGMSLNSSEKTPTVNGTIAWTYE